MKRNIESHHSEHVKIKCARLAHEENAHCPKHTKLDKMTRTPSKMQSIGKFDGTLQDTFAVNLNSSPLDFVKVHSQEDLSRNHDNLEYLITTPYLKGSRSSDEEQQYFKRNDSDASPPTTFRAVSQTPTPELHRMKCKTYAKLKKSIVMEQTKKTKNSKQLKPEKSTKTVKDIPLVSYSSTSETSFSSSDDSDSDIKVPKTHSFSNPRTGIKSPLFENFKVPVSQNPHCSPVSPINTTGCNKRVVTSISPSSSYGSCSSSPSEFEHLQIVKFHASPQTPTQLRRISLPYSNEKVSSSPLLSPTLTCDRSPDFFSISPRTNCPVDRRLCRKTFAHLPNYDTEDISSSVDIGFIDTHCHLDFLFKRADFKGSFTAYRLINEDTFPKTFHGCVAVFCDPQTFCKRHMWENILKERNVWGAFGCHPHMASEYNNAIEQHLLNALANGKVVALGEIGLDYSFKNTCDRDVQKDVFRRQLQLAMKLKLPLVIHSRDSSSDTLQILQEMVPRTYKIHRHCFTGTWEEAEEWLYLFPNLYIGLTPLVTFSAARDVHKVACHIPLNRLLLETDAPYFLPRNVSREKRWSHPGMAIHVAAQVAALRPNDTLEDVLKATRENTHHMYGI